jgi:ketosteroid isomerase-like protein
MQPRTERDEPNADNSEVFEFVERFAKAWSAADPDAFKPLLHPQAHLIHPIEPDTHGIEQAREFIARTMSVVPDLRYDVQGWAHGSGHVIIWGRLYGTVGGGPIEWPLVDRIKLEDGLIRERRAYFDPLVIFGTVIRRPRAWVPFLRSRLRPKRHR